MSRKKERSPELEEFDDLASNNAYHLLVHGRPIFHGLCGLPYVAVVWHVDARHHLLDFLYDSFTRALPLLSFTVLSVFTLIPSTFSRARRCSRQYADAVSW